ncbi:MAG: hypothetical protein ACK5JU_12825 [Bacteroidales bacterium]
MINKDYLYSTSYKTISDFHPADESLYIYGYSAEDRSLLINKMKSNTSFSTITFIELEYSEKDVVVDKKTGTRHYLRSSSSIKDLFEKYPAMTIYIDVSGLNNRVSAALLKNALQLGDIKVRVVYTEPEHYKIEKFKAEGVFNDLSERIDGVEPLPGFANIIPDDIDMKFIALLGFEGGRFTQMYETIQPPTDKIIPIIGVPGYRPEYPFVAYWGNRQPLSTTESWQYVKYAAANSIVDVYYLLKKIKKEPPVTKIKIAPIGTKPHAIGAILFAIKHPKDIEIVFDNPKRESKRTEGVGLIVESRVSELLNED